MSVSLERALECIEANDKTIAGLTARVAELEQELSNLPEMTEEIVFLQAEKVKSDKLLAQALEALKDALGVLEKMHLDIVVADGMPAFGLVNAIKTNRAAITAIEQKGN